MSGGTAFAECLASRLGYPILERNALVQITAKLGLSEKALLAKINAGGDEGLATEQRVFLGALQSALADACTSGNLVHYGDDSHLLLNAWPCTLHIRVIAPMQERVRAAMTWQRLSDTEAKQYIRRIDRERVSWSRFAFGVDWRDAANYDLIFNLTHTGINPACAIAMSAARLPSYEITDSVRTALNRLARVCRLEFAAATKNVPEYGAALAHGQAAGSR